MTFILYFTFIYLIILVSYYFIYLNNLTYNRLFTIILNFIFLIILPLYYFYFKDNLYSLVISIGLMISAFSLNLKIKEIFHTNKIPPLIYFLITSYILGFIIGSII